MDELKMRPYDGAAISGFLILPPLFSTGLSRLAEQNNTAAWITLLLAAAVMLCLFYVTACLPARYGCRDIVSITSAVVGRPFGILYGILLSAYFCFCTGVQIRESTEILKIYGLTLTPVYVVAGMILLAAVIMNFFGGRSIVKTAGLFFIVVLVGLAFVMALGLNRYNPDNLVPALGHGLSEIGKNSLSATSLFDSVLILFLFAPAFSDSSGLKKSGLLALGITGGAYVLLSICFTMMFSPSIGSQMMSGFIEMGKSSYYNHFFYRFESLLVLVLIFSSAIQASVGLFVARRSLSIAFKLEKKKTATIICAVPVLAAIILPANIFMLTREYLPLTRQCSVVFMAGSPLLVLMISTIKRIFKYEKN